LLAFRGLGVDEFNDAEPARKGEERGGSAELRDMDFRIL
jgi:hypothetical protein